MIGTDSVWTDLPACFAVVGADLVSFFIPPQFIDAPLVTGPFGAGEAQAIFNDLHPPERFKIGSVREWPVIACARAVSRGVAMSSPKFMSLRALRRPSRFT
jgi:hypothetical protein